MTTCKICANKTEELLSCLVLKKYSVQYFKCPACEFIQTEEPYWLSESYESAITSLDIGLIGRNIKYSNILEVLIKLCFKQDEAFVDYGGGYGMLVRMMRDKGFNFFRQDAYCENIFSKGFDVAEMPAEAKKQIGLLTAFEVFEHLVNPLSELEKMLSYSSNIFFSTTIYPKEYNLLDWWYLIPETGQHISLYSEKSLNFLAKKYQLNYYKLSNDDHLFTKEKIAERLFKRIGSKKFQLIYNRMKRSPASLLGSDFNTIAGIKM
jgi:2-polyprenyl-3-methyl-5-hydroxy-6-metoxy-1,4-benzoquinol methylase